MPCARSRTSRYRACVFAGAAGPDRADRRAMYEWPSCTLDSKLLTATQLAVIRNKTEQQNKKANIEKQDLMVAGNSVKLEIRRLRNALN